MDFRILNQDGPGRIGQFTIDNKEINSPNILFIDTRRIKSPVFLEIILTNEKNNKKKPQIFYSDGKRRHEGFFEKKGNLLEIEEKSIYVLKNASQIFRNPNKFTSKIIDNRGKIGPEKVFYLPAIAEPINLSILSYLGIDLFDSTSAIINARKKIMFSNSGNKKIKDLKENPCNCPICIKSNKKPKDMSFEEILNHNYYMLFFEIRNIRNSIRNNTLRDLVELRCKTSPNLITIFRTFDNKYYKYL